MTNYSAFYEKNVRHLFITRAAAGTAAGRRAAARAVEAGLPEVEEIADRSAVPAEFNDRTTLIIDLSRGAVFGRCPGTREHLCCNYHTVDLYIGCSLGCTYCIMNAYLNFAPIAIQVDTDRIVEEIRRAATANPDRSLRVGSGEVGDSLLFDPVFRLNEEIIQGVSDLPNVAYEIKTKTDYVHHLLEVPNKGGAVIGFSLNPPAVTSAEEGHAAAPSSRISAARRCVEAGYRIAFHFDPVIRTPSFPDDYLRLVEELGGFEPGAVAWVSIGTLRFPPALKDSFRNRPYISDEFVPCADGKLRYLQPVRREIYRQLTDRLRAVVDAPVYLCMESAAIWRGLAGNEPTKLPDLRGIFDQSDEANDFQLNRIANKRG